MKKKIVVLAFFQLCCVIVLTAQKQVKTDSLISLVKTTPEDTLKVNACNELFSQYEFSDTSKAALFLHEALQLAQKIGYKKGIGAAFVFYGYFAEDKGDNALALSYYQKALQAYEDIHYQKGIAAACNNMGSAYEALGNPSEALKSHFSALKISMQLNNKVAMANSYNNIGVVYFYQKNYPEALKNYTASLDIEKVLGNKKGMAVSMNNIAGIYTDQGKYDDALNYHFQSVEIKKEIGDQAGIAASYNNIGNVYAELAARATEPLARKKLFGLTLHYFFDAIKIDSALGNESGLAIANIDIGYAYIQQDRYPEAEKYLLLAKDHAEAIGYKECLKDAYINLSLVDSAKGDFKKAFDDHKMFILYRDSLDNQETRRETVQSQMTYDFEKKEAIAAAEHKKELESRQVLADAENQKQQMILLGVLAGLLLVLVFSAFIVRSLRMTKKQKNIIEQQRDMVYKQKEELEYQKLMVEEHQKEVVDSIMYARRIQVSQLPTEKYIHKTLKRLMPSNRSPK